MLLDMRPLQGPGGARGVGSYARGLLSGLIEVGFDRNLTLLLDAAFDTPSLPVGEYRLVGCRRRSHGNLAAYEDAVALNTDIARVGADVYHAIDFHLPGRSPKPVLVTLHDLIPWVWGGAVMRGERLRYWIGRRLLRRADAVIAVSQATADDAVRLRVALRQRLRVVPEAAGPAFTPRPGAAQRVKHRWGMEKAYLLFVGALDARKDPPALLRAWAVARETHPELQLLIAGEPGKQAPRMPGAFQLGRVEDEGLADLYSAAACLPFSSRYEGFGLPCLEAMACGCPVAAFRNSSIPEVVGDAGILVSDGDADALGRAAAQMVTQPDRWRQAGLRRAKQFSWAKTARETISAYETVLR